MKNLKQIVELYYDKVWTPIVVPATGKANEFVSVEKALERSVAFMVMPKNNVFDIDFDEDQESDLYREYRDFLVRNDIRHFEWNSGRPGHKHLVAAFSSCASQTKAWLEAKRLGLDMRCGRMNRPPGSPHQHGLPVSLECSSEEAIKILSLKSDGVFVRPTDPVTERPKTIPTIVPISEQLERELPAKYLKIIKDGDPAEPNRSKTITRMALVFANYNIPLSRGIDILSNPNNAISAHIIESRKTPIRQREYAADFLQKALRKKAINPPLTMTPKAVQNRSQLMKLYNFVQNTAWTGRTASSDRACLLSHLTIAIRIGDYNYSLSIREQEILAECTVKTCQKANNRLIETGWLRKIQTRKTEIASWVLSVPEALVQEYHTFIKNKVHGNVVNLHPVVQKGVFRQNLKDVKPLGKSAGRVYAQIASGKRSVADIAKASGMSRWTVQRALKRLEGVGMINDAREIDQPAPDHIVRAAIIKENDIKKRHQKERNTFNELLMSRGFKKAA